MKLPSVTILASLFFNASRDKNVSLPPVCSHNSSCTSAVTSHTGVFEDYLINAVKHKHYIIVFKVSKLGSGSVLFHNLVFLFFYSLLFNFTTGCSLFTLLIIGELLLNVIRLTQKWSKALQLFFFKQIALLWFACFGRQIYFNFFAECKINLVLFCFSAVTLISPDFDVIADSFCKILRKNTH